MKCNNCGSENTKMLAEDLVVCNHCGEKLYISFWSCVDCSSVFRVQNGEYTDVFSISEASVNEICDNLCDALNDDDDVRFDMTEMLHTCIKCGSNSVFKSNENEFKCPDCGFSWEILGRE